MRRPWNLRVKAARRRALWRFKRLSDGVTVVIVNWNTREVVADVIATVQATVPAGTRIVAVDNGSTDGSAHMLSGWPGIELVRHRRNAGHGVALDLAVLRSSTRITVTLDSDAVPLTTDWLDHVVEPVRAGSVVAGLRATRGFAHPVLLAVDTREFVRRNLSFQVHVDAQVDPDARVWGSNAWDTGELMTRRLAPDEVTLVPPTPNRAPGLPGMTVADAVYHHGGVSRGASGAVSADALAGWHEALRALAVARPLRLLFVSDTTDGGSGRSQRELATALEARGHRVTFIVRSDGRTGPTRRIYEQLADLLARWADRPGAALLGAIERLPGRRTRKQTIDGRAHLVAAVPQNALARYSRSTRPDIVIGNSLERLSWRRIHASCANRGVPTALYVRETDSLGHLERGATPDLLVANARSLQDALSEQGYDCAFVPSLVDLSVTQTSTSRRVALVINPIRSRGADIVWQIAEAAPEIPIVAQESWNMAPAEREALASRVATMRNVELRARRPPGPELYGDARVLLVPYRVDNRPRVILEAQANGIPVIAGDVPALREAIGPGGVVVALEDIDDWVAALRRVWADETFYTGLVDAARRHALRPEVDPESIVADFEDLIRRTLDASRP